MYSLLSVFKEFASENISKLYITQYNTTDITCTSGQTNALVTFICTIKQGYNSDILI